MSLLIKALESAEKGKQAELKKSGAEATPSAELVLELLSEPEAATPAQKQALNVSVKVPFNKTDSFNTAAAAGVAKVKQQSEIQKDSNQQVAANVFVANQAARNSTSATALLMLGVAGALLAWLVLQGYQYMVKLNTPDAVVVKPAPQVAAMTEPADSAAPPVETIEPQAGVAETSLATIAEIPKNDSGLVQKPEADKPASAGEETAFINDGNLVTTKSGVSKYLAAKKNTVSRAAESADVADEYSSELKKSTPLKLVSRTPAAGVDPTLLAAYEAYSRGDDVAAQKQYRQVLQSDIRNIDALLGMAAIAMRQSRYADANGWYQKVLEIEPRNSIALSAITNSQISAESADYAGNESRIKNMLAQQPEAANLHAALGNLYAAQNQWPLAQAAYFNASRYAPNSADYAFNLAVSLEQIAKADLALAQYQRALALLNISGASNLDRAQLEARIQALQH